MPLLPNNNPDGTLTSDIRLSSSGVSSPNVAGVRFGEPIPGPPGPPGALGATSMLAMSIPGTMAVSSGIQPFIVTRDLTILGVWPACGTAPVGSAIIFDLLRNGVSMFTPPSVRPSIPAGSKVGTLTVPGVVALVAGDVLTVDIVQIGSTTPGAAATLSVEVV